MRRKRSDITALRTKAARATATLLALGALLAAAVSVSGCGAAATLDPIARAAEISSQQPGAKIAMTMQLSSPELPGASSSYTITANGWFDEKAHNGEMTMNLSQLPGMSTLAGGEGQVQLVFLYPTVYMHMPALAGKLPEGKTWMKLDIAKAMQAAGVNTSSLSSLDESDPTQFLDYLRSSSGGVIELGTETLYGVATTHYQATLQLTRILEHLPAEEQATVKSALERSGTTAAGIPVNVWIDAQGRVRRIQLSMSSLGVPTGAPSTGASMSITIDFTSYGPAPAITPPPANEVFDASNLAAAGL
jgi:hypothetical protein